MDQYIMLRVLGEGSFGSAVLARHKASSELLALKRIPLKKLSPQAVVDAMKEVKVLSSLNHPHITQFKHSFEYDGELIIAMEYCGGGDLRTVLNQRAGVLFPQDRILDWFVQLCLAVKYIHDRHVLHRDIKSQNVFLTEEGKVKLGDFGISKVLENSKELASTCIGTPFYLSPEICQNKPYNSKSDVWALGCVLYEMATLKHPFEASCMKSLIMKIMKGSYRPLPSKFSWDVKALIRQILQSNPTHRPSVTTILAKKIMLDRVPKFLEGIDGNDDLLLALRERKDPERGINKMRLSLCEITGPAAKYGAGVSIKKPGRKSSPLKKTGFAKCALPLQCKPKVSLAGSAKLSVKDTKKSNSSSVSVQPRPKKRTKSRSVDSFRMKRLSAARGSPPLDGGLQPNFQQGVNATKEPKILSPAVEMILDGINKGRYCGKRNSPVKKSSKQSTLDGTFSRRRSAEFLLEDKCHSGSEGTDSQCDNTYFDCDQDVESPSMHFTPSEEECELGTSNSCEGIQSFREIGDDVPVLGSEDTLNDLDGKGKESEEQKKNQSSHVEKLVTQDVPLAVEPKSTAQVNAVGRRDKNEICDDPCVPTKNLDGAKKHLNEIRSTFDSNHIDHENKRSIFKKIIGVPQVEETGIISSTPVRNLRNVWSPWDPTPLSEAPLETTRSKMDSTTSADEVILHFPVADVRMQGTESVLMNPNVHQLSDASGNVCEKVGVGFEPPDDQLVFENSTEVALVATSNLSPIRHQSRSNNFLVAPENSKETGSLSNDRRQWLKRPSAEVLDFLSGAHIDEATLDSIQTSAMFNSLSSEPSYNRSVHRPLTRGLSADLKSGNSSDEYQKSNAPPLAAVKGCDEKSASDFREPGVSNRTFTVACGLESKELLCRTYVLGGDSTDEKHDLTVCLDKPSEGILPGVKPPASQKRLLNFLLRRESLEKKNVKNKSKFQKSACVTNKPSERMSETVVFSDSAKGASHSSENSTEATENGKSRRSFSNFLRKISQKLPGENYIPHVCNSDDVFKSPFEEPEKDVLSETGVHLTTMPVHFETRSSSFENGLCIESIGDVPVKNLGIMNTQILPSGPHVIGNGNTFSSDESGYRTNELGIKMNTSKSDILPKVFGCESETKSEVLPQVSGCESETKSEALSQVSGCESETKSEVLPQVSECESETKSEILHLVTDCDSEAMRTGSSCKSLVSERKILRSPRCFNRKFNADHENSSSDCMKNITSYDVQEETDHSDSLLKNNDQCLTYDENGPLTSEGKRQVSKLAEFLVSNVLTQSEPKHGANFESDPGSPHGSRCKRFRSELDVESTENVATKFDIHDYEYGRKCFVPREDTANTGPNQPSVNICSEGIVDTERFSHTANLDGPLGKSNSLESSALKIKNAGYFYSCLWSALRLGCRGADASASSATTRIPSRCCVSDEPTNISTFVLPSDSKTKSFNVMAPATSTFHTGGNMNVIVKAPRSNGSRAFFCDKNSQLEALRQISTKGIFSLISRLNEGIQIRQKPAGKITFDNFDNYFAITDCDARHAYPIFTFDSHFENRLVYDKTVVLELCRKGLDVKAFLYNHVKTLSPLSPPDIPVLLHFKENFGSHHETSSRRRGMKSSDRESLILRTVSSRPEDEPSLSIQELSLPFPKVSQRFVFPTSRNLLSHAPLIEIADRSFSSSTDLRSNTGFYPIESTFLPVTLQPNYSRPIYSVGAVPKPLCSSQSSWFPHFASPLTEEQKSSRYSSSSKENTSSFVRCLEINKKSSNSSSIKENTSLLVNCIEINKKSPSNSLSSKKSASSPVSCLEIEPRPSSNSSSSKENTFPLMRCLEIKQKSRNSSSSKGNSSSLMRCYDVTIASENDSFPSKVSSSMPVVSREADVSLPSTLSAKNACGMEGNAVKSCSKDSSSGLALIPHNVSTNNILAFDPHRRSYNIDIPSPSAVCSKNNLGNQSLDNPVESTQENSESLDNPRKSIQENSESPDSPRESIQENSESPDNPLESTQENSESDDSIDVFGWIEEQRATMEDILGLDTFLRCHKAAVAVAAETASQELFVVRITPVLRMAVACNVCVAPPIPCLGTAQSHACSPKTEALSDARVSDLPCSCLSHISEGLFDLENDVDSSKDKLCRFSPSSANAPPTDLSNDKLFSNISKSELPPAVDLSSKDSAKVSKSLLVNSASSESLCNDVWKFSLLETHRVADAHDNFSEIFVPKVSLEKSPTNYSPAFLKAVNTLEPNFATGECNISVSERVFKSDSPEYSVKPIYSDGYSTSDLNKCVPRIIHSANALSPYLDLLKTEFLVGSPTLVPLVPCVTHGCDQPEVPLLSHTTTLPSILGSPNDPPTSMGFQNAPPLAKSGDSQFLNVSSCPETPIFSGNAPVMALRNSNVINSTTTLYSRFDEEKVQNNHVSNDIFMTKNSMNIARSNADAVPLHIRNASHLLETMAGDNVVDRALVASHDNRRGFSAFHKREEAPHVYVNPIKSNGKTNEYLTVKSSTPSNIPCVVQINVDSIKSKGKTNELLTVKLSTPFSVISYEGDPEVLEEQSPIVFGHSADNHSQDSPLLCNEEETYDSWCSVEEGAAILCECCYAVQGKNKLVEPCELKEGNSEKYNFKDLARQLWTLIRAEAEYFS